jgi:hypothetical protein
MHKTKKREIVEQALHEACAYIQNELGIKTGDTAGLFFCGENEEIIYEVFNRYLEEELRHGLPQLHTNEELWGMAGKYSFEFDNTDTSNFIVSDCGRFSVSPEKYGFELVHTGDNSMAYSQDFIFNRTPVTLVITDNDRAGKPVTKETINAHVTMYHTDTVDHIDSYVISR